MEFLNIAFVVSCLIVPIRTARSKASSFESTQRRCPHPASEFSKNRQKRRKIVNLKISYQPPQRITSPKHSNGSPCPRIPTLYSAQTPHTTTRPLNSNRKTHPHLRNPLLLTYEPWSRTARNLLFTTAGLYNQWFAPTNLLYGHEIDVSTGADHGECGGFGREFRGCDL